MMSIVRRLVVVATLVSLLGCSRRFGPDGMPTDMQGTWTFYAPFFHDDGKIKFSNGRFHAHGHAELDDASTLVMDGTYHLEGKTLHITFDSVVADISPKADRIPRDLIQSDVTNLLQIKTLNFRVVPKGNGVIELVASKEGMEGSGNVDFTLEWGGSANLSAVSTSMGWLSNNGSIHNGQDPNGGAVDPGYPTSTQAPPQQSQDQPAQQDQQQQQQPQAADQGQDQPPAQPDSGPQNPQDPAARPGGQTNGGSNPAGTG